MRCILLCICLSIVQSFYYRSPLQTNLILHSQKKYPFSQQYFENYMRRLNSKNVTIRDEAIMNNEKQTFNSYKENIEKNHPDIFNNTYIDEREKEDLLRIFGDIPPIYDERGGILYHPNEISNEQNLYDDVPQEERRRRARNDPKYTFIMNQPRESKREKTKNSENFQIVDNITTSFADVGGYDSVKQELYQCVDILQNYEKYSQFNVRIPKGLILEGPPGNGKTLLAKAFAGEAKTNFIAVAGSEFQEKYVGVGSSRIKELFKLAKENKPCVIFIDEIDALGRTRSNDGETSSSERDSTLNQLLVQMDGFENSDGIFVVGASNRADLLDPALIRPGRIDKRIFIGVPDSQTRRSILEIHMKGKPRDDSIVFEDLVDLTTGMSAAQIENLLNEAMLYTLRDHRFLFTHEDIELVLNRVMAGWQPTEHQFTDDMIERITIHEMGHAMIGLLMKQHSKMTKIVINLSSPKTPGYTVFEGSTTNLYTREALFEHLMILLAGRIAEEIFYNVSVTTGAINDFEEALKLAEKMVIYYGMGDSVIYPSNSEKSKTEIDEQVKTLINNAYKTSDFILKQCKDVIFISADILKRRKILKREELFDIIWQKHSEIFDLY